MHGPSDPGVASLDRRQFLVAGTALALTAVAGCSALRSGRKPAETDGKAAEHRPASGYGSDGYGAGGYGTTE